MKEWQTIFSAPEQTHFLGYSPFQGFMRCYYLIGGKDYFGNYERPHYGGSYWVDVPGLQGPVSFSDGEPTHWINFPALDGVRSIADAPKDKLILGIDQFNSVLLMRWTLQKYFDIAGKHFPDQDSNKWVWGAAGFTYGQGAIDGYKTGYTDMQPIGWLPVPSPPALEFEINDHYGKDKTFPVVYDPSSNT